MRFEGPLKQITLINYMLKLKSAVCDPDPAMWPMWHVWTDSRQPPWLSVLLVTIQWHNMRRLQWPGYPGWGLSQQQILTCATTTTISTTAAGTSKSQPQKLLKKLQRNWTNTDTAALQQRWRMRTRCPGSPPAPGGWWTCTPPQTSEITDTPTMKSSTIISIPRKIPLTKRTARPMLAITTRPLTVMIMSAVKAVPSLRVQRWTKLIPEASPLCPSQVLRPRVTMSCTVTSWWSRPSDKSQGLKTLPRFTQDSYRCKKCIM